MRLVFTNCVKLSWTCVLLLTPAALSAQVAPREITFAAGDVPAFADVYEAAAGKQAATILLFHQGGADARGEYREIVPRLVGEGYNVMAVDARGGGDRFGGRNRAPATDSTFTYCSALAEVEGAINAARVEGFSGPLVLWGSSYTASLVMQIGARRAADVVAVLGFSPATGPPMAGCEPEPYAAWLSRAGVATLIVKPKRETESEMAAAQLAALRAANLHVLVPDAAAHASSVLSPSRNANAVEPLWTSVLTFLRDALQPRHPATGDRRVVVESEGWQLIGDLRLPANPRAPVIAMFNKAAGSRRAYDSLAVALERRGIASLRIDLRGHGGSINRGRFIPGQASAMLENNERDIIAVHRWLASRTDIDTARIGFVGASYSAETMAEAGRLNGFAKLYVALSPGSFSDASFAGIDGSGAKWLIARSSNERFVREWLDQKVRQFSRTAELWVVAAGAAHASDMLIADAGFSERLAEWIVKGIR